jgi:hypothetical protein
MISDKLATVIIAVITTVWVLNLVVGMFGINNYEASESINGIFMAIVGGAFALRARGNDKDKGGGDSLK